MGAFDAIGGAISGAVGGLVHDVTDMAGDVASGVGHLAKGDLGAALQDGLHFAQHSVGAGLSSLGNFTQPSPPSSGSADASGLNLTASNQALAAQANPEGIKVEDKDQKMLDAQQKAQDYNRMITLLTSLLQMQHEAQKAIIQNFRA